MQAVCKNSMHVIAKMDIKFNISKCFIPFFVCFGNMC